MAGCVPGLAAELSLEELMRQMAEVRESRAVFSEEKTIAALAKPLLSAGTLHYTAPALLEKHTEEPTEERLVVDGNQLTLERPAEHLRQTLTLEQQPEIRALVESIRGTLSGNLAGLRQYYSLRFEGGAEGWHLTLAPLNSRVQEFLKSIRLDGKGTHILLIETLEANGDSSRMTIKPVTP